MPRTDTTLTIFVSSPSDMTEERDIVEQIAAEINGSWSSAFNIRFEVIRWERDALPGVGKHPQDVINQEMGNRYDIFLGLMWHRFGSPTDRAGSGTEEEFNAAYNRHEQDPSSVRIMFYFKTQQVPPGQIEPEQLSRVNAFQSKLGEKGVLWKEFSTPNNFADIIRGHLNKIIASTSKNNLESLAPKIENPSPDLNMAIDATESLEINNALDGMGKDIEIVETAQDYFLKGNAHAALGQLDEAIRSFKQSLEIKKHGATFGNRGAAYVRKGEFLSAIADYNQAIELMPDDARWYSNRGNLFIDLDDLPAAIRDLNQAILLDPKLREARNNRGRAYIQLKDPDRALKEFDELTEREPGYAVAYVGRGAAYADKQEFNLAIEDYTKAIDIDPSLAPAFTNRGNSFRQLGELEQALRDLNRAVDLVKDNSAYYGNRSAVYLDLDELDLAYKDCNKSLELNPKNVDATYNLACVLSRQNNVNAALEYLGKAVELSTDAIRQSQTDPDLQNLRDDPRSHELLSG